MRAHKGCKGLQDRPLSLVIAANRRATFEITPQIRVYTRSQTNRHNYPLFLLDNTDKIYFSLDICNMFKFARVSIYRAYIMRRDEMHECGKTKSHFTSICTW